MVQGGSLLLTSVALCYFRCPTAIYQGLRVILGVLLLLMEWLSVVQGVLLKFTVGSVYHPRFLTTANKMA